MVGSLMNKINSVKNSLNHLKKKIILKFSTYIPSQATPSPIKKEKKIKNWKTFVG